MPSARTRPVDDRAWMTVEDFAERIGHSRRQVARYVRNGTVQADCLVDRNGQAHVMIRASEVEPFLAPVSSWAV